MRNLRRNMKETKTVKESVQSKTALREAIYDWAKDYILDTIDDWEGQSVYGADLASELTDAPNRNGIYEDDSWGFISKHLDDAAREYDYQKDTFGEVKNPFEDPEGFVVVWLIDAVGEILANVDIVDEHWNDELELTADVIKEIKDAL